MNSNVGPLILVQNGKHASLDEPTDQPHFRGCKRSSTVVLSTMLQHMRYFKLARVVESIDSDGVHCIDQLEKWSHPCTSGVIDESEYHISGKQ